MYRVIFKSVNPRTQLLVKEHGPWLPRKEDAEEWAHYFNGIGHHAHATVEGAGDRSMQNHEQS
ncbi:MAG TPA: hypothetical protein VK832_04180 [Burkholderiaceae bacterium]|jgi:hypothetical protein|nr:hypothetical protein [Burkholderiaceae bacterium]